MGDSAKQKILFIAGMPASGKSTLSQQLAENFGFKHISAGQCLREEMENPESSEASLIKSYIDAGEIVPGHITLALMRKKINSFGWGRYVVIIDGFPRNIDNVTCWVEGMGDAVEAIFLLSLECSEETMRARLALRTKETERSDDNHAVLRNRMRVFDEETRPVVLCFMAASKGKVINADRTREEVWEEVKNLVISRGLVPS